MNKDQWLSLSPTTIYNPLTGVKRFCVNSEDKGGLVLVDEVDPSATADFPLGSSSGVSDLPETAPNVKSVYIAGAWVDMLRLREQRDKLEKLGYRVTSRWMEQVNRPYSSTQTMFEAEAFKDYEDIKRADFLIIDTLSTGTRGGREWEGGFATGTGKPVFRVGPIIIPFHTLVDRAFESWEDALEYFRIRD